MVDPSHNRSYYYSCMPIDRGNLVFECEQQPHQHAKIARESVLQASRLAALDMRVKRAFASRARDTRARLKRENDHRVTDSMVTASVEGDLTYQSLLEEKAAAKQELGLWEALREASKDRGFAIRNLVDLWIAGLLTPSEPRMSSAGQRARDYGNPSSDSEYEIARAALSAQRQQDAPALAPANKHVREGI